LYATTIDRADIRLELEHRQQETKEKASVLARARLWWADKSRADTADRAGALGFLIREAPVFELTETRERENGTAAAVVADRLRRVQATRRGLGVSHTDAPMPLTRRKSLVFVSTQDPSADLTYSFVAGWEPPGLDAESARYALFVAKHEQFERVRDEENRRWKAMTPEQREADRADVERRSEAVKLHYELKAFEEGRTASWPPPAPGQWSWPLERAGPMSR
jgi:hypothetical protein